jgi:hypothetical protein
MANYCQRDAWVTLGIMQTAGESLNWFRRAFGGHNEDGGTQQDILSRPVCAPCLHSTLGNFPRMFTALIKEAAKGVFEC